MNSMHAEEGATGMVPSVLATGQQPSRGQRKDRYVPESMRHPGKMLPAIAAQVIAAYTRPGELVVDPMCGIGTTLVEAVHQGRDAVGVEYEPDFARLTGANIAHARQQGATGKAEVLCHDARHIDTLLRDRRGQAALVLTSPPYGSYTHGRVRPQDPNAGERVTKWDERYSNDRMNLAYRGLKELLEGFGRILAGSSTLLQPGGVIAVTVRPIRVKGELIDLPGLVVEVAEQAGLVLADRLAALLCAIRDGQVVTRASFFQMLEARRLREKGIPACATAHEDLLVFQRRAEAGERPAG
ncbi:TRM11 family SAM-dependent methyltransferase [Actinomadura sp. SCN-SB]|uniref:TRM11 family SAM-dependent methyltransferase n=1 Tax=Actinomadura sp. SCN-SB TaxID=3373092 RepID=UPI0037534837